MIMNTTEYRIKSAEALSKSLKLEINREGEAVYMRSINRDKLLHWQPFFKWEDWRPDEDSNQMLMVWDWMKKQSELALYCLRRQILIYLDHENHDIKLATGESFMEYIKQ